MTRSPLGSSEAEDGQRKMKKDTLHKLVEALKPFMPISIKENRDYAKVSFGEHQTQAMTMAPDDWAKLGNAFQALSLLSKGGGIDTIPEEPSADAGTHIPRSPDSLTPLERELFWALSTLAGKVEQSGVSLLTLGPLGVAREVLARAVKP